MLLCCAQCWQVYGILKYKERLCGFSGGQEVSALDSLSGDPWFNPNGGLNFRVSESALSTAP